MSDEPILELQGVKKYFDTSSSFSTRLKNVLLGAEQRKVKAIDDVDLTLSANQVQGVIGESGCGKTTLLRTIIGLYRPTAGDIVFDDTPMADFTKSDWSTFRQRVQLVFQDPFNSLDPKFTVRSTLKEMMDIHDLAGGEERIYEMLEQVGLNPPEKYLTRFPNQLSGGEKQRVSIARALICEPDIILADEPASMLDVSTQAKILRLLRTLTDELDVSIIYISHDLSTVSYVCDRVNVMYLGRIVEEAPTNQLLSEPKHPYTQALINAIPLPDPRSTRERTQLSGEPGNPIGIGTGCRFRDRCPDRMPICDEKPMYLKTGEGNDHKVACHLYYDHSARTDDSQGSEARSDTGAAPPGTPSSTAGDTA